MKGHSEKALKAINEQGFSESKIKTSEQIFSDYKNSDFPLTPTIPNKWVPLDEAQKLERLCEKRKEVVYKLEIEKHELEADNTHIHFLYEQAQAENEKLEADLKRANMKLDTIDAVAKQLVKMTNIATELQIQKDEANKILDEIAEKCDLKTVENFQYFERLRGVLK